MPEVMAARSGREPTLRSAPAHRRPAPRQSLFGAAARHVLNRPGRVVASALFAACTVAIVLNALAFQTARHPAPLFAEPSVRATPAPASPALDVARAPLPPQREPGLTLTVPAPAPVPVPATRPDTADRAPGFDPIGALIRENVASTTASLPAAEPDPRTVAVQEALLRLGHGPLTVDGRFGPATSAAIARFEAQQGLEVTGGLDPDTMRALAVRSGLAIPAQ